MARPTMEEMRAAREGHAHPYRNLGGVCSLCGKPRSHALHQGKAQREEWPRLSASLPGERRLDACQACGAGQGPLTRWEEHDADDRPEGIVVVLCPRCSRQLIEPHPRLYRAMQEHEPMPGAMPLCTDCRWRGGVGLECEHPRAKRNGGPGVLLTMDRPVVAHVQRSPRRLSGFERLWLSPARACDGREA